MSSPGERALWRDITLAGRVAAALRHSEARFEAAFDATPAAMLLVSVLDGRPGPFVRVNAALCQLTGYRQLDLYDLGFPGLAHPAHPAHPHGEDHEHVAPLPDTTVPTERTCRWVHSDGHPLWVRVSTLRRVAAEPQDLLVCSVEPLPHT